MEASYQIEKVLNNNVVIANDSNQKEVVLIGKGIGFSKKRNDQLDAINVDKLYILHDEYEQNQYKQLMDQIDESFILVMNDVIQYSEGRLETHFNEHIHIALTDHLAFAIKRFQKGLDFVNPFLTETQVLYPKAFSVAKEVVKRIGSQTGVYLPEGEIGFIALHIHSAMTNRSLSKLNSYSQLINKLVGIIEEQLHVSIDRTSMNYMRLVQHLRHEIERIERREQVDRQEKLAKVLKEEYPICYTLSWKLMKVMQQTLKREISDTETVYLTLHLQRLSTQIPNNVK